MKDSRFRFNPNTLGYEEIKLTRKEKIIRNIVTPMTAGFVLAVLFFVLFSNSIDSPEEKILKHENHFLELQYKILYERYEQTRQVMNDIARRDSNIYRAIFEADMVSQSITDPNRFFNINDIENEKILSDATLKLEELNIRLDSQLVNFDEIKALLVERQEQLASIPAIQPLENNDLRYFVYGFGQRLDPLYKSTSFHPGIDYAAPEGTEVRATADGVVEKATEDTRIEGIKVVLKHGNGYKTVYSHLSEILVKRGQRVKRGDIIALVGNTGKSMAPHLHYEVLKNGTPQNPVNFFFNDLSPQQFNILIEQTSRGGQSLD